MNLKMKSKKILLILITIIFTLNISVSFAAEKKQPSIGAGAAILMETDSEKVLFYKQADQKMYPASTTKIMTAILTIENCKLDDIVTVPYEAIATIPSGYAVVGLMSGEQLPVDWLLQLMLVHSANDAANVLAYHISGDITTFADLMNKKLAELGLKNTHFTNPSGMHDENHYTTARDLALLMKYCMKNETFRKISGQKYCKIPTTNKFNEERVFDTTNLLLLYDARNVDSNYYYEYAIAGKTGYTHEAKNCLISVSNKEGFELISVVLSCGLYEGGLSGRFVDSKKLFNYGYNNYLIEKVRQKNAIATHIEIPKATKDTKDLDLLIKNDIYSVIPQDELENEVEPKIEIKEDLIAPIEEGQVLGTITYTIDGTSYSSNLIASHNVEKFNWILEFLKYILVILILALVYKVLFVKKSKNKKTRRSRKVKRRTRK